MTVDVGWRPVQAHDGHRWDVLVATTPNATRRLVWLPALGVPARHYEPFARAMAERDVDVIVHEWRGLGSSSLRASRTSDWAYRELLTLDIPATLAAASDASTMETQRAIGGHSLGGQLATCSLALAPESASELWLVASGSPYVRAFSTSKRLWLPAAYRLLHSMAQAFGALPGRRIGFGGQEARGVIRDWSRTGLTGRYEAPAVGDIEPHLRALSVPVTAVLMRDDWLAPRTSLDYLVAKTSTRDFVAHEFDEGSLGTRADHFAWMKSPITVVDALLRRTPQA